MVWVPGGDPARGVDQPGGDFRATQVDADYDALAFRAIRHQQFPCRSLPKSIRDLGHNPWPRAFERVIHDVQVANRGQQESVMQADVVRQKAHAQRDHSSAHDGHDQQSGTIPGQGPQLQFPT